MNDEELAERLLEADRRCEKYGEMTFIRHLRAKIAMKALQFIKPWIVDSCLANGDDGEPDEVFFDLIDEALSEAGITYETIDSKDGRIAKVRIMEDVR